MTRRLENEVAFGDAAAALRLPPIAAGALPQLATAPDIGIYVRSLVRTRIWAGQAADAAEHARSWWAVLPPHARPRRDGVEITLALAEAELATGQASAAAVRLDALLQQMQRSGATGTWLYREAEEWAALAAVVATPGTAVASAALSRLDRAGRGNPAGVLKPPTQAARIDAALRRAQLLRAAGRTEEAAAALAAVRDDVARQHPANPRRLAAAALSL